MSDSDIILDVLRDVPHLDVYDGHVTDSDDDEKTISAPLPYAVYYSLARTPTIGDSLAFTLRACNPASTLERLSEANRRSS